MPGKARRRLTETLAHLAEEGLEFFTLDDLMITLGLDRTQAQQLGHRLTKAGLAKRVRRGLYVLLPAAEWGAERPTGVDWLWAAANAVRGEAYYLAYYTAMELHRMAQHPVRTVFVAVKRRFRDTRFGAARIRFVRLAENKFFGEEEWRLRTGHVVRIAQLERTFIDGVDRPDLCGGIEEVYRGFTRRHDDLDPDRLIRFVHRLGRALVTKRLGFLLEAAGHGDPELLWELERLGGTLRRYAPLDKTRPAEGERNKRWELILNVDLKQLLGGART